MIIFLASGQLGNQIFQYTFLKTIQKNNEKLIVSGFEELKEVFEIDDFIVLNRKNWLIRNSIHRIIDPVLNFLSKKKIISSISVNHERILKYYSREKISYSEQKGLFALFTYVKLGYFQSELFFDNNVVKTLKIKEKYLKLADEFLEQIPFDYHKVFIHIRRGDYKDFNVLGKSSLLPMNYYEEQIELFLAKKENCFFILLSNEPDLINKEFENLENKIISNHNHYGTDLAIMTKCNSGILSPSSFGWWGSYLMQDRDTIIAPKYWMGFNSGVEFGTEICNCPTYATEVVINNS